MNSAKPVEESILFFDRDPEETARLQALDRSRLRSNNALLDAKIEAYFEQRIMSGR